MYVLTTLPMYPFQSQILVLCNTKDAARSSFSTKNTCNNHTCLANVLAPYRVLNKSRCAVCKPRSILASSSVSCFKLPISPFTPSPVYSASNGKAILAYFLKTIKPTCVLLGEISNELAIALAKPSVFCQFSTPLDASTMNPRST